MIKQKCKHTTINGYYDTLKTMIIRATKKKVIQGDPLAAFERFMNDRKELKIVIRDELKSLFVRDWGKVWNNDFMAYTANKLAAITGMRCCEVLGLEFVSDDNLFLA